MENEVIVKGLLKGSDGMRVESNKRMREKTKDRE